MTLTINSTLYWSGEKQRIFCFCFFCYCYVLIWDAASIYPNSSAISWFFKLFFVFLSFLTVFMCYIIWNFKLRMRLSFIKHWKTRFSISKTAFCPRFIAIQKKQKQTLLLLLFSTATATFFEKSNFARNSHFLALISCQMPFIIDLELLYGMNI